MPWTPEELHDYEAASIDAQMALLAAIKQAAVDGNAGEVARAYAEALTALHSSGTA